MDPKIDPTEGAPKGFHLITEDVVMALPELARMKVGMLHLFLQHTSASLTLNENADPDVRMDLEDSLHEIAQNPTLFGTPVEGPDDMPAHVKSSLIGCELTIPIGGGRAY